MAGPGGQYRDLRAILGKHPTILNEERKNRVKDRVYSLPDSGEREEQINTILGVDQKVNTSLRTLGKMGADAGYDPNDVAADIEEIREDPSNTEDSALGDSMIGGAKTILRGMDYVDKKTVRPIKAALAGVSQDTIGTSSDMHAAIEEAAKTSKQAGIYQTIAPAVGAALLVGGGAPRRIGAAVLGSIVPTVLDHVAPEGAGDFARDFLDDAGISLWNVPGQSSVTAGTMGAAKRLLRSARTPQQAEAARASITKIIGSEFKPGTFEKVKADLVGAGVSEKEVARAFGTKGERLMRGQGTLGGKELLAEAVDAIARKAGKGGGHGEYLGEKALDLVTKPVQKLRVGIQNATKKVGSTDGFGGVFPGVSRRAPAVSKNGTIETLGQERQRLRLMDQAESEARAGLHKKTNQGLAAVRAAAPQSQPAIERLTKNAFDAGVEKSHQQLEAALREITKTPKGRDLPEEAAKYLSDFSPKLTVNPNKNAAFETGMKGLETWRGLWNRKMLSSNPIYTTRNVTEDATKMFAAGVPALRQQIPGAAKLTVRQKMEPNVSEIYRMLENAAEAEAVMARGGTLSAEQSAAMARIKAMEDAGVDLGSSLRADVVSGRDGRRAFQQEMADKAGIKLTDRGDFIDQIDGVLGAIPRQMDKLPAWTLMNRKAMDHWEKVARTAVFEDGIAKGMAPQLASERMRNVLLDYGKTLGANDRVLKNLFSFLAYKTQAPVAAARLLAANPGKANQLRAAGEAAQPYPTEYDTQAPRYQQERGMTVRAPTPLNNARRAILGDEQVPEQSNITLPVAPINELQQPVEIAQALGSGSLPYVFRKVFSDNLSPALQMFEEARTGQRALTGQEISQPGADLVAKMVNVLSPSFIVDAAIENGVNAIDDENTPDHFIGKYENVSTNEDTFLKKLLNIPGVTTDPNYAQEYKNLTSGAEADLLGRETRGQNTDIRKRKFKRTYQ